jgi:hypothetical protein
MDSLLHLDLTTACTYARRHHRLVRKREIRRLDSPIDSQLLPILSLTLRGEGADSLYLAKRVEIRWWWQEVEREQHWHPRAGETVSRLGCNHLNASSDGEINVFYRHPVASREATRTRSTVSWGLKSEQWRFRCCDLAFEWAGEQQWRAIVGQNLRRYIESGAMMIMIWIV